MHASSLYVNYKFASSSKLPLHLPLTIAMVFNYASLHTSPTCTVLERMRQLNPYHSRYVLSTLNYNISRIAVLSL